MKVAIIIGLIILVGSTFFLWDSLGESINFSDMDNPPSIEELSIPMLTGSLGVIAGFVLIIIGFKF